jgi:hypothetical protein
MVESLAHHLAAPHLWALAPALLAFLLAATVAFPAAAGAFGGPAEAEAEGLRYSWAVGYQNYSRRQHVTGLWATMQNERPSVDDAGGAGSAHSLGQLWAIEYRGSCMSDVEMGWTVSPGQYGDAEPHLFVYAWDCGVGLGYVSQSSIPWVQYSGTIAPNATLRPGGELHLYGAALRGGNWWFSYDGQWLGYIPASAWTRMFPAAIGEALVGGEVVTAESEPCTAMGNEGLFGASSGAALVADVRYQQRAGGRRRGGAESRPGAVETEAELSGYESDPSYTTGGWSRGHRGSRFRYGGPGRCG